MKTHRFPGMRRLSGRDVLRPDDVATTQPDQYILLGMTPAVRASKFHCCCVAYRVADIMKARKHCGCDDLFIYRRREGSK